MKLHNNKEAFMQAIAATAAHFNIAAALVEKDYYVTLVLEKIKEYAPGLLFKGGTSLSKCHKIIDRFSEDIDLTLDENHFTEGQRKKLKYVIIDVCNELGLTLTNAEETRSRRAYNNYRIEYPINYSSSAVNSQLLVETVFIQKAYPYETKTANSLIGEWLLATNNKQAIDKYELYSFEIRVQALERTLVDKVFAICDYIERNVEFRQSRHIYDISRLLTKVELDDGLKELIKEVRKDRKPNKTCVSAQDGVSVPELLQKVITTQFFKKDYEDNTLRLLTKPVDYDEAIKSLEKIIESGVFATDEEMGSRKKKDLEM